MLSSTLGV
uniref:Uncharacterized protein n=1 Tax=Arundo donax TaxID=35708 RepID=A0A0A9CBJ5_ARUDO